MLTLRKLYEQSTDASYKAAIAKAAEWAGWEHEATREIMASIERLAA